MAKTRIIVEILIVLALALGVWRILNPPSKKTASGPTTEEAPSPTETKLLRGKKSKDKPEVEKETERKLDLPLSIPTGRTAAPATGGASDTEAILGGLQVTITDPEGARLPLNGWLVSDDCSWRIRIFDGVVDKQIEEMRCEIYAILDVDGKEFATEKQSMQTRARETLSMRFALTLPSTEPETPAIAHAGLGLLQRDGFAEVVEILPGSSASTQGLQIGDAVLSVNGLAVTELTQDELALTLQGEPESEFQLEIAIEENGEIVAGQVNLIRGTVAE